MKLMFPKISFVGVSLSLLVLVLAFAGTASSQSKKATAAKKPVAKKTATQAKDAKTKAEELVDRVRAAGVTTFAVTDHDTVASLPELPTIAEQGFPDVDIAGWFALIGPAKMPAADVKRLHDAVVAAFAMAETKEAMAKQENVINPLAPEASAAFFRSEQERYARLVKKANITLD